MRLATVNIVISYLNSLVDGAYVGLSIGGAKSPNLSRHVFRSSSVSEI